MSANLKEQVKTKNLFTIPEAREEFFENKISDFKFRQMLRDGEIPSFRLGRKFFIRRSAIEAWMAEQERQSMM